MPGDNVIQLKPMRPCPVCRKPSTQANFPFCSARCADIDLNRWLSGAYVIPGRSATDDADASGDENAPSLPSDSEDDE